MEKRSIFIFDTLLYDGCREVIFMENTKKNDKFRWDQQFSFYIMGVLIAVFIYRLFHDFLIPILLNYSFFYALQNPINSSAFLWINTFIFTIMCTELIKAIVRNNN